MASRILRILLLCSILLVSVIFFSYRGFGWPFGKEGTEGISVFAVLLVILFLQVLLSRKKTANPLRFEKDIFFGLMVGLLWTLEIGLNNLIIPPLPARDFYDNVFWAVIAAAILVYAGYRSFQTNLKDGVLAGFSSGLGSGAVACATALLFIVFGMRQLLSDPLNLIEWSKRGAASNTPDMSVYFAYQTLAGAILHLLILGLIMGLFLGIVGGIIGKSLRYLVKSFK